jgi:hypothetical protein
MKLLDHIIGLLLIFKGTSMQSLKIAVLDAGQVSLLKLSLFDSINEKSQDNKEERKSIRNRVKERQDIWTNWESEMLESIEGSSQQVQA